VIHTGDQVDLTRLPLIKCWPTDGDLAAVGYPSGINDAVPGVRSESDWLPASVAAYITLGTIHTIHADDVGHPAPPSRNVGMYRVQLFGPAHHGHALAHAPRWGTPLAIVEGQGANGCRWAIALGGESVLPMPRQRPCPRESLNCSWRGS
jgi:3-polyprenyl-4-hydroxybenzoate decarboxylase